MVSIQYFKSVIVFNVLLGCFFTCANSFAYSYSNLKLDETVEFINTSAYLSKSEEYWLVPIHTWVYEPQNSHVRKKLIEATLSAKYNLEVKPETKTNFNRRVNLLISDNERGKKLTVSMAGKLYKLKKTNSKGHSYTVIKLPKTAVLEDAEFLNFNLVLPAGDTRAFSGRVLLIGSVGTSIISDIDDTVKISNVTDHEKLFDYTFYQDFQPVKSMPELYRNLSDSGFSLHFVSSSPWQLYPELTRFMDEFEFPPRTLSLKMVRFRDSSFFNLFKKGSKTKPKQIEPILRAYPNRRFVLIGDSGEQDEDVYKKIKKKYKDQIIAIFIRQLGPTQSPDSFSIKKNGIVYFSDPMAIQQFLQQQGQ